MDAENALDEREVFEIAEDLSQGAWMLKCGYIHHVKILLDGVRFKSRMVVLGCGQKYGIVCDATFAPMSKADSIRILFPLCFAFNLHIHQMNVQI
jgi:hypothetical protein